MRVFSIHDAKAEAYLQPFFAPNEGVALRYVETACNDLEHEFHRHSEDYTLHEIGGWDEETGELDPCLLRVVARLFDLVKPAAAAVALSKVG